jgi:hypothetical protein
MNKLTEMTEWVHLVSTDLSKTEDIETKSRSTHGGIWLKLLDDSKYLLLQNTGQFKKKVTLSRVYNEVTSEPIITRYA